LDLINVANEGIYKNVSGRFGRDLW
jgi:hypothetical protein